MRAKIDYAKERYQRGWWVQVLEPYFKVGLDGSRFVRIDDPSDVKIIQNVNDSSSIANGSQVRESRKAGNAHF